MSGNIIVGKLSSISETMLIDYRTAIIIKKTLVSLEHHKKVICGRKVIIEYWAVWISLLPKL
jgi:hypothetical protein